MLNRFFEFYNNKHEHTGQGMGGKTPMQVWAENEVPKREVPEELKPYLLRIATRGQYKKKAYSLTAAGITRRRLFSTWGRRYKFGFP
jgi:hypothetical protein